MDPLQVLPSELVLQCLEHCQHDFPALSRVSRDWHELLETPSLWWSWLNRIEDQVKLRLPKEYTVPASVTNSPSRQTPNPNEPDSKAGSSTSFPTTPTTPASVVAARHALKIKTPEIFDHPKKCFRELLDLSSRLQQEPISLLMTGIEASTEDGGGANTWSQDISQTLNESRHTFWSSKGAQDPLSSEYLVYQMIQPACIVTGVRIIPFRAAFQRRLPTYAPRYLTIRIGYHRDSECMAFVSKEFKVRNVNEWQYFPVGPFVVSGGYIRLEMRGRYETQPSDDLYYTVLQQVEAVGYPIGALQGQPNIQAALFKLATFHRTNWLEWDSIFHRRHSSTSILKLLERAAAPLLQSQRKQSLMRANVEQLIIDGDWEWACDLVLTEEDGVALRTDAFLKRFKGLCESRARVLEFSDAEMIWNHYLGVAVAKAIFLVNFEAMELARKALKRNSFTQFWNLIVSRRAECNEELGDLFFPVEPQFAASIYLRGHVFDKVLDCLIVTKRYTDIIQHIQTYVGTPSEVTTSEVIAKMITVHSHLEAVSFSCILLKEVPAFWNQVLRALDVRLLVANQKVTAGDTTSLLEVLTPWAQAKDLASKEQAEEAPSLSLSASVESLSLS
ncbi:hypothetical protein SmJEL517_g02649 [Synchytrium microbalum]|uniref:F-box domain-containing protein n=1 Tax=Synchytrium microbalum TaxID=1806994 RepID=A0A507C636_9FUNG|nr:uncharacterized protein SmJEL517_g02649 [Synchytrium microbalum]TPX34808.1 hypothetical protein SmJEL517_g02649 [Synchytrium microbalum]